MSSPTPLPLHEAPAAETLALATLLHLVRRVRHARSPAELGYIAVNETHALSGYRQAALWLADRGVTALSGMVSPEANAPYVQWIEQLATELASRDSQTALAVEAQDISPALAEEWQEWLPIQALWVPILAPGSGEGQGGAAAEAPAATVVGGLLLAREHPWNEGELGLLAEWIEVWGDGWHRLHRPTPRSHWRRFQSRLRETLPTPAGTRRLVRHLGRRQTWGQFLKKGWQRLTGLPWRGFLRGLVRPRQWRPAFRRGDAWLLAQARLTWTRPRRRYTALALLFLLFPVRLTLLAPGELVPAHPAVIRAPLEGTVDRFFVSPNSRVKAGDPLFQLDLTTLESRLEVARQGLATAEAEYRQSAQQAVFEAKSKALLAQLQGRVAERKAEADYLESQLLRAQVTAPLAGVVLMDDPSEWVGKPVVTGERILTVADEHDAEVEAWISLGDGIDLPEEAAVTLYLNAAPLSPVAARVRYYAHEAVARPDGSYAYRLRARLEPGETAPRVGMKGTAKVRGPWVTASYWILRRPLAILRQAVGL
ncbi:efflux RND transporter periplasmic adaptor subunit [Azospira sp. I13]|uniref:efflux RND transporter periplasmic adaptor subunit n=1 Tax=Azospira sp. I13 TaxID=1765050 RepID=UPI001F45C20A|nr:HlyD family efflux transporter periplasmic adaptor subunit [Azospira sp. I13]